MNETTWLGREERFWRGGVAVYDEGLAREALMVFGPPAGVMDRAQTLAAMAEAPRWQTVNLTEMQVLQPAPGVAIVVYLACASRGGGSPEYLARCSSVYLRRSEAGELADWRLALHQQTPLPPPESAAAAPSP